LEYLQQSSKSLRVGVLPYYYGPDANPYQKLFCDSLEASGCSVARIQKSRFFPTNEILDNQLEIVQFDWLSNFYTGKNRLSTFVKRNSFFNRLKQLHHIKKVWTIHNLFSHDSKNSRFEKKVMEGIVNRCDGLIFHTSLAKDIFSESIQIRNIPHAVVPHGHYIDAYENTISRQEARKALCIPNSSKVVLFFGRMRKYKGLEELVHSFARTCDLETDFLVLAGLPFPDYPVEELRKLAANLKIKNFIFEPRLIDESEFQIFFNSCDIVSLPFKNILNSGSLILAMSFGCPIVAPKIGSIPEVVYKEAYWGYEPDDKNGLDIAITLALSNASLQSEKRNQNISACKNKLSWKKIGAQLKDFYETL